MLARFRCVPTVLLRCVPPALLRGVLVLLLAAVVPRLAHAQERSLERTFALDANGSVELSTFSGEVVVSTWGRDEVDVQVRIVGEPDAVDKTKIEFRETRRSISIETNFDDLEDPGMLRDRDDISPPDTYFTLRIPRTAELELNAFSADIDVSDLAGDLSIEAFSSDIEVDGLDGELSVDIFSGDVEATGLRGEAEVNGFSSSINLSFDALTDDVDVETFSGGATLRLPRDAGFDLDTDLGMSGDLETSFDLSGGEANGGGPRIAFKTFSGYLSVRTR